MTDPASIPIRELLATAANYRRMADEIETHVNALIGLMKLSTSIASVQMVEEGACQEQHKRDGRRNKPPGIVTAKWATVLLKLAHIVEDRPFTADKVIEAARQSIGRIMRAADVRRQFEPYLVVGYFVEVASGVYKFTPDGFAKIGFEPNAILELEHHALHANEAPVGMATGASEAGTNANPFQSINL